MIREINIKDIDFMVEVERLSEGYSSDHRDSDKMLHKKMLAFFDSKENGGFIYETDRPVGLLLYSVAYTDKDYSWPTVYKEIPKKYLWDNVLLGVYNLWVDPEFRRQGIASSLKNKLETFAIDQGFKQLFTHTELANEHVIKMNLKLGYDIVRVGPIWDESIRVSLLKPLTSLPLEMLEQVQNGGYNLIDAETLIKNIGKYTIIDIRKEDDFNVYHFEQAKHIEWEDVYKHFDINSTTDKAYVIVCNTGQSSMQVATALQLMGIEAYSLLDGMEPLKASNFCMKN